MKDQDETQPTAVVGQQLINELAELREQFNDFLILCQMLSFSLPQPTAPFSPQSGTGGVGG